MNNTYGKVWGIHKIPKSVHLSHGLPPPTTDILISLANSSHRWQASGVSCGRYRTRCLLVRGGRSIKFISSSEGGDEGGRKVFIQFLHRCCSMAATRSISKCLARSLAIFFSPPCLFLFLLSKQGFRLSTSSHQPSLVRLVIGVRKVSD